MDYSQYFISLAATAATATIVTGYVTTHLLKTLSSQMKQVASWVIAIGICFLANWQGWGLFADLSLVWTAIYGLATGLVSNGIFDINVIQIILGAIGAKKKTV